MVVSVYILLFSVCLVTTLLGQGLSSYINVSDPEAISRLDLVNRNPLRYKTGFGYPQEKDASDDYHIIAGDTGVGIISHWWMTVPESAPETAFVKLYIDDKLVRQAKVYDFFRSGYGLFRLPFTTPMPWANICDIQMPYKKNFRITLQGVNSFVFYAVAWRRNDSGLEKPFDPLTIDIEIINQQTKAEEAYRNAGNPWGGRTSVVIKNDTLLQRESTTTVFKIDGGGLIHSLRLTPESYDQLLLDSLWLDIVWDGAPFASVSAPIGDFFMVPADTLKVRAFHIRVDKDSGLTMYFPMPFRRSAEIRIVNKSVQEIHLASNCTYEQKEIDVSKRAYFHSVFSETNSTRYHVFHPVLSTYGNGRFIGASLRIKDNSHILALEGDTFMDVDNDSTYRIQYTGTEDYIGGGYYFHFLRYSLPFSGHTQFSQRMYRFHYLDAIEFKQSFDFKWQHGNDNDVKEDYRTVGYYYKLWTPFWTSSDTIRYGQDWSISGSGYQLGEKISVKLDNEDVFSTNADSDGGFTITTSVLSSWKSGYRKLSVNGVVQPREILILQTPILYSLSDFQPPVLHYNDSLLIRGTGFIAGEKIAVYLDSILISATDVYTARSDHSFEAVVRMPYIADRTYRLAVHGEHSSRVVSETPIIISRNLDYEFEDLVPTASYSGNQLFADILSARWYAKWSKQSVASFYPKGEGDSVRFIISIPKSDTFELTLLLSKAKAYGKYSYYLDNRLLGDFDGFFMPDPEYRDILPSDSIKHDIHYLSAGEHIFTFRCIGKNDSASDYFLGADVLLLRPTTILPLSPGTITDTTTTTVEEKPELTFSPYIYPNPVSTKGVVIGMTKDNLSSDSGAVCTIRIIDASGRTMFRSMLPFENFRAEEHIKTETFAAGSYFVIFTYTQGKETREFSRLLTVTK